MCCVFCRRTRPPPSFSSSLFSSLQEPLKNNSCALGALLIWSRRAQGKSELYFLQNTDQRGKNWPCFRGPFTSNLCLFSFFLPLSVVLSTCPLLPVFPSTLFCPSLLLFLSVFFSFSCSCLSPGAAAVSPLSVLYVRRQVKPGTGHTHPHVRHSCISSCLCDLNLCVHTDSPPRCSQIWAIVLASHRASGRVAQPCHAHGNALARRHINTYVCAYTCTHDRTKNT